MAIQFDAALTVALPGINLGVSANIGGRAVSATDSSAVPFNSTNGECSSGSPSLLDCMLMLLPELDSLSSLCEKSSDSRNQLGTTIMGDLDILMSAVSDIVDSITNIDPLSDLVFPILRNAMSLITGALNALSSFSNAFLDCLDSATGGYVGGAFNSVKSFASQIASTISGKNGLSIGTSLLALFDMGKKVIDTIKTAMSTVIDEIFNLDFLKELICSALSCLNLPRLSLPGSQKSPMRLNGLLKPLNSPITGREGRKLDLGLGSFNGLGMKEGPQCSI